MKYETGWKQNRAKKQKYIIESVIRALRLGYREIEKYEAREKLGVIALFILIYQVFLIGSLLK
jgi:hypothetical protein